MKTAIVLAAAYLAGSVNFSILLFRWLEKGDPRQRFSGNAGVTNVYRQAGLFWAAAVLILDLGRALLMAWTALQVMETELVPWVGLALVLGNRFPCFHQFRGGKGVAGYLGFTILISPLAAGLSALAWVAVYGIVRIPFIASFFMIAVLAGGTIIAGGYNTVATGGAIATALFIYYNHMQNIAAHLAETPYVLEIIEKPIDPGELRKRPTARMIMGLFLVGLSYLIGWPAVGAFSILAVRFQEPLILAIGGPVTYGLSHLVFLAGAWLAGASYVKLVIRYAAGTLFRKILRRTTPPR